MQLILRPCANTDLDELYRLDQICFQPGIAYPRSELRYYLQHPRFFSLAAVDESEGKIYGFAVAKCGPRAGLLTGHLITIDVDPEMRHRGAGTLLLQGIERELRRRGAAAVRLEVAVDNEGAQAFYRRAGYTQTGLLRGYYLGTLDALVMEKAIGAEDGVSGR